MASWLFTLLSKKAFKFFASVVGQREWIKSLTSHSAMELKRVLFVPCFIRARARSNPLKRKGLLELFYHSSSNTYLFACLSATVFLCRVTGNLNRPNSAYDKDTRNVQCIHVCTLPIELIGSTTSVDVCTARERDNLVPRVLSRGDVSECTSQPPRSCSKYTSATTTTCRFHIGRLRSEPILVYEPVWETHLHISFHKR